MTRSMRKTSPCPFTALFVALLFCTVTESYNTANVKYCINSRHMQSPSFDAIYCKKLNINTLDSFSLRSSISQSQPCKHRSTFSSTVQLFLQRAQAWSGPRGIVMRTMFQKCAVICTMFLSTFLGRSQRVFAASAPLVKNVKVRVQLKPDESSSFRVLLLWRKTLMLELCSAKVSLFFISRVIHFNWMFF